MTRDISIVSVNDAPVVSGPGSAYSVDEQVGLAFMERALACPDADAGAATMIATVSAGDGSVTIVEGNSGVLVTAGNGTGSVQFIGDRAAIDSCDRDPALGRLPTSTAVMHQSPRQRSP